MFQRQRKITLSLAVLNLTTFLFTSKEKSIVKFLGPLPYSTDCLRISSGINFFQFASVHQPLAHGTETPEPVVMIG